MILQQDANIKSDFGIGNIQKPQFIFEKQPDVIDTEKIDDAITPWDTVKVFNDSTEDKFEPNKTMKKAIRTVLKSQKIINAMKKS